MTRRRLTALAALLLLLSLAPLLPLARPHLASMMWLARLRDRGGCDCPEEHYICPLPAVGIAREGRGLSWVAERLRAMIAAEPHRWELWCALADVETEERRRALGERVLRERMPRWRLWRADDDGPRWGSGDAPATLDLAPGETLVIDVWLATVRAPDDLARPTLDVLASPQTPLALSVRTVEDGLADRAFPAAGMRSVYTDGPVLLEVTVPADAAPGRYALALEATLADPLGRPAVRVQTALPAIRVRAARTIY